MVRGYKICRTESKKSNSVSNEIVQICKETELSNVRLRYVKLLINSCLDSKIKYGCALWNVLKNKKNMDDLNKMKPSLIKRVLQLPSSTPSDAILYEFGINDLTLDILMEKVVLAVDVLSRDGERVAKKLLNEMLSKNVPGFCTELSDACNILKISLEELVGDSDIRKKLKEKVVGIQGIELYKRMVLSSKMDKVLLNGFRYSGKMMTYLLELEFQHARAVFMIRYRMLPTKCNFPNRWDGLLCNVCGLDDTDEHLFSCPGYQDLIVTDVRYEMFWDEVTLEDAVKMGTAATVLVRIIERLEEVQDMIK